MNESIAIKEPTWKERVEKFKYDLADIFDEDLSTKKWGNIPDYLIIGMIVLSTLEIFLSTFELHPTVTQVLFWIEVVCLIFFTVEVTLRIWVAPIVHKDDPRFRGWKGRLRYCFTFNGFIDVISTYPFYLQWLIPFPVTWMRVFRMSRTIRLFRLSRYMESWKLLSDTIKNKKRELLISLQFLLLVTLILSLFLFFCEHEAQPDVYNNGFKTVSWAFAQYIGDPGHFGDTPPVTTMGKVIACAVGLLGIAIFAVPAGILGSGFTEAIEKMNSQKELSENRVALRNVFERKLDRPTGFQYVSFFRSIIEIQARTGLTQPQIVETVSKTPSEFRLVNLASTIPVEKNPADRLAVEHFTTNTPYGLKIDRKSRVTIVSPSSMMDPGTGIFSFYLALIGGFNYISRELGVKAPYRSFYTVKEKLVDGQDLYLKDLKEMVRRKASPWTFSFLASSGANEMEYDSHFHFGTGNPKGPEHNAEAGELVADKKKFDELLGEFSTIMKEKFQLETDHGKYYNTSSDTNTGRYLWSRNVDLPEDSNNVILRMAWSEMIWNDRRMEIAREMAAVINRIILNCENPENNELKIKRIGFEGYDV